MDDPLLEHLSELFYSVNLTPPDMVQSPMISDENYWMHLNVTSSDQLREGLPCGIVAAVDIVKSRTQIDLIRGFLRGKYHGDIVGDKLSGLHIYSKLRALKLEEDGEAVFELLKEQGTTTRTEYNARSLYSTKAVDPNPNWFLAKDRTLNIAGSSNHIIDDYHVYFSSDLEYLPTLSKASHLGDRPVYVAFLMHRSTPNHLLREDCLFVDTGEQTTNDLHAMMVYGYGTCERVDQPWIKEDYWVARNSWGRDYPLVVRGSMNCVDTLIVPFVH